jgi:molybdate transport system permease protein
LSERLRQPLHALSALLALYLLVPIGAYLVRLHSGLSLPTGAGSALLVSLLCASIATALIALCGVPLAYLLARSRSRAAATLETLLALPLALPPLMIAGAHGNHG